MLRTAGFVFLACCALSALSLADARKSKPSATVSPASDFDATTPPPTTTTASTTTPTTTTPTTTTASTTTTTPTTTTATTTTTPTTTTATTTTTPTTTTATTTTTPTTTTPTTTASTTNATTTTASTTNATTTTASTTNATTTTASTTNATTTTAATTTAAPTSTAPPSPDPPVGDYNLTNSKNEMCLKAQVALQIRWGNKMFTVQPKDTTATGGCDETRVVLNLTSAQGFINFNFTRDVGNNNVYVDAVAVNLNLPSARRRSANVMFSGSNTSLHLFPAKIGHSYSCRSDSLYMGKDLYLDVTKDKMQAFNLTKNDFGYPDPCPADRPDYRVAIGVGVTLLVLIVVVLVAYLLSRRRRMDGYQSL